MFVNSVVLIFEFFVDDMLLLFICYSDGFGAALDLLLLVVLICVLLLFDVC